MATDVSKDLKKLSKTWSKTEPKKGGGGSQLPDGEYVVSLQSMEVKHAKSGRLQVVSAFKIKKPKNMKGKDKLVFHGLENENNIAFFKGFAEVIGLELPDDMEDLPDALQSFVDENEDDFTVKFSTNSGGYQNMSILSVGDQEVVEKEADEDADEEETESEDEDESEGESEDEDEETDEDEDDEEKEEEEDEGEDDDEDSGKKRKKARKEKREKKKKKRSRR